MTAVNKKYGNIFHPQNHTPLPSTSRLAPAPPDNNHATLEEEGSKGDANRDQPAALLDDGTMEGANKSEKTKPTREDHPADAIVASQLNEGSNAAFPIITMASFRSKFKSKRESEDSNPAKKRAKGVECYDDPYDYDHIKPPLQEFTPDDNGRVAGSLATYIGLRKNSAGNDVPFSEDIKRPQATWPFNQQLTGAFVPRTQRRFMMFFVMQIFILACLPR